MKHHDSEGPAPAGKNWVWDLIPSKGERAAFATLFLGLAVCVYLANFRKKVLQTNWFESEGQG